MLLNKAIKEEKSEKGLYINRGGQSLLLKTARWRYVNHCVLAPLCAGSCKPAVIYITVVIQNFINIILKSTGDYYIFKLNTCCHQGYIINYDISTSQLSVKTSSQISNNCTLQPVGKPARQFGHAIQI